MKGVIDFKEFYDDNGETEGFAVRLDGREGYGAFYPVTLINKPEREIVAGDFCGIPMEGDDLSVIKERIAKHPLVDGHWSVQ